LVYYTAHIGAQFNRSQLCEAPILQSDLFRNTGSDAASPRYYPPKFTSDARQSYQLAMFLNEQADYKSLVVPTGDTKRLARNGAHSLALKEQIVEVDALVGDIRVSGN
jgi:hypothetical protein